MAEIGAEPSMEEILSSIKRIIAEDGDGPSSGSRRQAASAAAPAERPPLALAPEQIIDAENPSAVSPAASLPPVEPLPVAPAVSEPAVTEPVTASAATPADTLLSTASAAASRHSIEALSKLVVKSDPEGDGTLEGLVRSMLKPMLREWLDTNLPAMVETMVAREIARITEQQR